MKNKILKSIIAILLPFMALPVMGQDFMNIYFKNGDFRKFYLENVTEITTSNFDANGIQHSDIDYQHITTIYDRYVYDLQDVDSITFTKIDEEIAEDNFVTVMSSLVPVISNCETISDAEKMADVIKNMKGVNDVWSDGHQLFIKVDEWETFSFHFNHNKTTNQSSSKIANKDIKKLLPLLKTTVKPKEKRIHFGIANQTNFDERSSFESDREYYYHPLIASLNANNIDAKYIERPTLDFFYDNSDDPENDPHLYDLDAIFLDTHGAYVSIYDNDIQREKMIHRFATGEELGSISESLYEWDILDLKGKSINSKLKKLRKKYKDATDQHIYLSVLDEIRNGKKCIVFYAGVTEKFFEQISTGHFLNPNSLFYNGACQSLKGYKSQTTYASNERVPSNYSLANIFIEKGLGTYVGFNQTVSVSPETGYYLFLSMLNGKSIDKACNDLEDDQKMEYIKDEKVTAYLMRVPDISEEENGKTFLIPTYTNSIDQEKLNEDYQKNQTVTLTGQTTSPGLDKNISGGFLYGVNKEYLTETAVSNDAYQTLNLGKGNIVFSATISGLQPGNTYFYRAYTYDGLNYNYGDTYSFEIDPAPELNDLQISSTELSLVKGNSGTVEITSGNDSYTVESSDPSVATATLSGNTITIEALKAGQTTITVTDTQSSQTATIAVTVTGTTPDIPVEAVDLGLPSGTLWASYNVGASKPEEYGGYYAWGETEEKDFYDDNTYLYSETNIGDNIAGTEYDVAHTKWGGSWQMPTKRLLQELFKCCSFEWTTVNGVEGGKLTGPNGNSIFLPAGQLKIGYGSTGTQYGAYWSSEKGLGWRFYMGTNDVFSCSTYEGLLVRPVIPGITGDIPGKAIDLGLPSGTKWASYNVGATAPDDYGGYYAWGETEEKDSYDLSNYNHCDGTDNTYHNLGESIIGTEYDVATVKWGSQWHMPTKEQFEELINNCSVVFGKTKNGVYGIQFTGPNGNKIFLPAAGCKVKQSSPNHLEGKYLTGQLTKWGDYVSDSMCDILSFDNNSPSLYYGIRYWGVPVRPVTNE